MSAACNSHAVSYQLSAVEPVSCNSLPASSEPVQSYIVSPLTAAVLDHLQPTDEAVVAASRQLDVTADCHSNVCDGSLQNGLTTELSEAVLLQDQRESKVGNDIVDYILFS